MAAGENPEGSDDDARSVIGTSLIQVGDGVEPAPIILDKAKVGENADGSFDPQILEDYDHVDTFEELANWIVSHPTDQGLDPASGLSAVVRELDDGRQAVLRLRVKSDVETNLNTEFQVESIHALDQVTRLVEGPEIPAENFRNVRVQNWTTDENGVPVWSVSRRHWAARG